MKVVTKYMTLHRSLILLILLFSYLSCKTGKIAQNDIPSRSKEEVFAALQNRNVSFKWFSAKADAKFDSPEISGSGSLSLRICKDSLVWMMGKKFSIEGFRSVINKDSFYLINRIQKYYQAESNSALKRTFGVDLYFEDLQELLAGNIFLPEEKEVNNYLQTGDNCIMTCNTSGFNIKYSFDAYDLKLRKIEMEAADHRSITVNYDSYKKMGNMPSIPYYRKYSFQTSGHDPVYTLELQLDEVEFNVQKTMAFNIPSHYERMRI